MKMDMRLSLICEINELFPKNEKNNILDVTVNKKCVPTVK